MTIRGSNGEEVLVELNRLFREMLSDGVQLTRTTVASEVDGWDSLTHISLMLAVEETFGVRCGLGETDRTKNVGELVDLIVSKLGAT